MIISLVTCTSSKKPYRCEARELYSESPRFRLAYSLARKVSDKIYILSAKHGLIKDDTVIEPYNEALKDKSSLENKCWAEKVIVQLKEIADLQKDEFIILAAEVYYRHLLPYLSKAWVPLKGKSLFEWIPELKKLIELEDEKDLCKALHILLNKLPRLDWTMINNIPFKNGIYIMFEKGQSILGMDRIVRVGTHRGHDRLITRLKDHFVKEDSDRSIFRKNIGRVLLNKAKDPYINVWELDYTKAAERDKNRYLLDEAKESKLEEQISDYLRYNVSFVCLPVETKIERLRLEEGIIALLNQTCYFKPSDNWIGLSSPISEISSSGLWNRQGLDREPLNTSEFNKIKQLVWFGYTNDEYTSQSKENNNDQKSPKVKTIKESGNKTANDIRDFINQILQQSKQNGEEFVDLVSGRIHNDLAMRNRMPQVCRIMYEKMKPGDEILHTTPSGKSSTIAIRYYLYRADKNKT